MVHINLRDNDGVSPKSESKNLGLGGSVAADPIDQDAPKPVVYHGAREDQITRGTQRHLDEQRHVGASSPVFIREPLEQPSKVDGSASAITSLNELMANVLQGFQSLEDSTVNSAATENKGIFTGGVLDDDVDISEEIDGDTDDDFGTFINEMRDTLIGDVLSAHEIKQQNENNNIQKIDKGASRAELNQNYGMVESRHQPSAGETKSDNRWKDAHGRLNSLSYEMELLFPVRMHPKHQAWTSWGNMLRRRPEATQDPEGYEEFFDLDGIFGEHGSPIVPAVLDLTRDREPSCDSDMTFFKCHGRNPYVCLGKFSEDLEPVCRQAVASTIAFACSTEVTAFCDETDRASTLQKCLNKKVSASPNMLSHKCQRSLARSKKLVEGLQKIAKHPSVSAKLQGRSPLWRNSRMQKGGDGKQHWSGWYQDLMNEGRKFAWAIAALLLVALIVLILWTRRKLTRLVLSDHIKERESLRQPLYKHTSTEQRNPVLQTLAWYLLGKRSFPSDGSSTERYRYTKYWRRRHEGDSLRNMNLENSLDVDDNEDKELIHEE
eukprot:GHVQ01034419.1.p2 GENE.GHVQ01034419.1~~GHVQ01034419.1.p2  ORF type:complete len:549 (-),score=55.49 GHVQ01034419.1:2020-3666(-)